MRRVLLGAICAALVCFGGAPYAQAASNDPLFFYTPQPPKSPTEPPGIPPVGYLDGPCGLAVSPNSGQIYLSDYYHRAVDAFSPSTDAESPNPKFSSQPLTAFSGAANPHTGPLDDPCGLSLDSSGVLYVNDYHREVVRFPVFSLESAEVIDTGDPADPYSNPTGVAVDPADNHAFVDDRTYVAEYDASGGFVRKIGEGALGDAYSIAVSDYVPTLGYIYVPDAFTDTVKVFDPSFSTALPKETISGPPGGGFGSLQDSAVAVDYATGEIYVVDTLGPQLSERPQAIVYVFAANGAYEGRLKHATVSSGPVGLAVDNSATTTQSRVYLTSGLGENASLYGYPPHAATSAASPPLLFDSSLGKGGGNASPSGGGGSSSTSSASASEQGAVAVPSAQSAALPASSRASAAHRARKRRQAIRRHRIRERRLTLRRHRVPRYHRS